MKFVCAFLIILILPCLGFAQRPAPGQEMNFLLFSDSPKDSAEFVKKMEKLFPGAGVGASCMATLEDQLGYINPEVIVCPDDSGESVLCVNICRVDTTEDFYVHNEKTMKIPGSLNKLYELSETLKIQYFELANSLYYLYEKGLIDSLKSELNGFNREYKAYFQLDCDTILLIMKEMKTARASFNRDEMLEYYNYTDDYSGRILALGVLLSQIDNFRVFKALALNMYYSSQGGTSNAFNQYFRKLPNDSFGKPTPEMRALLIKLLKAPKLFVVNTMSKILTKFNGWKNMTHDLKGSDFPFFLKLLGEEVPFRDDAVTIIESITGRKFGKNYEAFKRYLTGGM